MSRLDELNWVYFPKTDETPKILFDVIEIYKNNFEKIRSDKHKLKSNIILEILSPALVDKGFKVEQGKKKKIPVPVLFGDRNSPEKTFEVDAYNSSEKIVIEVEAGRAVKNYQFLKDIFEASVMINVDYLVVSVLNHYHAGGKDYDEISTWLEIIYSSHRIQLDLKGLLLIGH